VREKKVRKKKVRKKVKKKRAREKVKEKKVVGKREVVRGGEDGEGGKTQLLSQFLPSPSRDGRPR
jgi:hypothetical protein